MTYEAITKTMQAMLSPEMQDANVIEFLGFNITLGRALFYGGVGILSALAAILASGLAIKRWVWPKMQKSIVKTAQVPLEQAKTETEKKIEKDIQAVLATVKKLETDFESHKLEENARIDKIFDASFASVSDRFLYIGECLMQQAVITTDQWRSFAALHKAYNGLGGNDVGDTLYERAEIKYKNQ